MPTQVQPGVPGEITSSAAADTAALFRRAMAPRPQADFTAMYGAPAAAPAVDNTPMFTDAVTQAEQAAGKPLDEQTLLDLKAAYSTTIEPYVWNSRRGITAPAVKAELSAIDANNQRYIDQYLGQHGVTPGAKGTGGFWEGLYDAGKAAAGDTLVKTAELARLAPGGVAALADAVANAGMHAAGNKDYQAGLADLYFGGIDTVAKPIEDSGRRIRDEAIASSPIAGNLGVIASTISPLLVTKGASAGRLGGKLAEYLARVAPGATAVGAGQTLGTVSDARDKGATAGQQQALLAEGLTGNTVANLLPAALVGKTGGALRRAAMTAVQSGAAGAATNVALQGAEHAIAPDQIAAPDRTTVGIGGGVGAGLGLLAQALGARGARARAAAAPPPGPAEAARAAYEAAGGDPARYGVVDSKDNLSLPMFTSLEARDRYNATQAKADKAGLDAWVAGGGKAEDYLKAPRADVAGGTAAEGAPAESGTPPPPAAPLAPGAGITDNQLETVMGEVRNQAGLDSDSKAIIDSITNIVDPAARVREVIAMAELTAEDAANVAGNHWGTMSAAQRAEATAQAAEIIGNRAKVDGMPEALQALRASPAAEAAPQVSEVPGAATEPPPAPVRTEDVAAAAEAPPAADLPPSVAPDPPVAAPQTVADSAAREVADEALSPQASVTPSPVEPLGSADTRTAAQAKASGSPAEVAQHAELDRQLGQLKKEGGLAKRFTKATLGKMTLADKQKMLADAKTVDTIAATGAEIEANRTATAKKTDPLKKPRTKKAKAEPVPPKAAAPGAAQPPGAEANRESTPSSASQPSPVSQSSDVVGDLLAGKVFEGDIDEVRVLLDKSKEGDSAGLFAKLRELQQAGDITADEAKLLRQAGRKVKGEGASTTKPTAEMRADDAATAAKILKNETAVVHDVLDAQDMRSDGPRTAEGKAAAEVASAANAAASKVNPLRSAAQQAAELVAMLRRTLPKARNVQQGVDLLEWVLQKNPNLIRAVNEVQIAKAAGQNFGGRFDPITRIIEIVNTDRLRPTTIVHELLHAAEALLPSPIREAIMGARAAEISRLAATARPIEQTFFQHLAGTVGDMPAEARMAASAAALDNLKLLNQDKHVTPARFSELYGLTDSSEFWAVNATDLLQGGYFTPTIIGQAKRWLGDFINQLRSMFGDRPNKAALIAGLRRVLGEDVASRDFPSDLALIRDAELANLQPLDTAAAMKPVYQLITDPPSKTVKDSRSHSLLDDLRETFANQAISFDKVNQGLYRLGVKVSDQLNSALAVVRLSGQRENFRRIDRMDVIEPIEGWFVSNWQRYGKTSIEAVDKLGVFLQTHHALTERLPAEYAQSVPLNNGMEVRRQRILGQISDLKMLPKPARAALDAIVAQHASLPFDQWGITVKGKIYTDMVKLHAKFGQEGINSTTMSDLNDLVQKMNDRRDQRLRESGKLAVDDPWREFYGHKWYVPLQGSALDGTARATGLEPPLQLNELAGITRQNKPYMVNLKQLQTAEGRQTWASNPLLRAMVNADNAGGYVADHNFTEVLVNMVRDSQKKLRALGTAEAKAHEFYGAKFHVYQGVPRGGYTDLRTGAHVDTLPKPANSFVHNNGRTHTVVELANGSDLYHGLESINTTFDPREFPIFKPVIEASEAVVSKLGFGEQTHLISRATQLMAKANTIVNPVWTGTIQLPRTMGEKYMMLAIKEGKGPIDGVLLWAKAYADTLAGLWHGGGRGLALLIDHNFAELRRLGQADPDSWAGLWVRMNDAGGGTAFTQGLTMHETNNSLVRAAKVADRGVVSQLGHGYMKYAMGWSDALENISSIGIFRRLLKEGMDEATAAAKTKDLMNFQQSGTAGRAMNGFKAYFRVTMTANDTMFRAFQHPAGVREVEYFGRKFRTSLDWNKMAKWGAVMSSYAAMRYAFDRATLGEDDKGVPNIVKAASGNPYSLIERSFLPQGNTDKPFVLAVGLGFPQLMIAPGTLAAAVGFGDITKEQAADAWMTMFQRNISVVDPVVPPGGKDAPAAARLYGLAMGAVVPTPAMPLTSLLLTNTDSFGRNIRTGFPNPNKMASDQGKRSTPVFWKETAQQLQEHTGVDMYPESLAFVVRNYGGSAINDVLRFAIGQDPRINQGLPTNALEAVSRLRLQNADYYYSTRMYDVLDQLAETQKQYAAVQSREGEQQAKVWLGQNRTAAAQLQALKTLSAAQRNYSAKLKELAASKDGPERKMYRRKQLDSALRVVTDNAAKTLD